MTNGVLLATGETLGQVTLGRISTSSVVGENLTDVNYPASGVRRPRSEHPRQHACKLLTDGVPAPIGVLLRVDTADWGTLTVPSRDRKLFKFAGRAPAR